MLLLSILVVICLCACVKELDSVELSSYTSKVVVDGRIESGSPPIVLLTKSVGYFEETGVASVKNIIIRDAQVKIVVDGIEIELEKYCSAEIPDSLMDDIAGLLRIPVVTIEDLVALDVCIYTTASISGEQGKSYTLKVAAKGDLLEATTRILEPVGLDSLWFSSIENTRLGYVGALLDEPPVNGNAYRVMTQRIGTYPEGGIKDVAFFPARHSVFDDRLINGAKFEFFIERGTAPGSQKEEDKNYQKNLFSIGDTVMVKFISIDQASFQFFRALEMQEMSKGNPFAAPSYIKSNVKNGLGIWAGYSSFYDTVLAN